VVFEELYCLSLLSLGFLPLSPYVLLLCPVSLCIWRVPCPVQWATSIFSHRSCGSSPCEHYVVAHLPQPKNFSLLAEEQMETEEAADVRT